METTLEADSAPFDIGGFFNRRRVLMTWIFSATFIAGLLVTLLLPSVYRSTATILIEQQEIPEDLVRSTVTSFADQRIEMISQRVMTTTNLWSIIEKYDLYADDRRRKPREQIIKDMRNDIDRQVISADVVDPRSGRPVQATIAFSIAFDAESPVLAQRVANELTSLFLKENIKTRSDMADQTEKFLSEEATKLKLQIAEMGATIADFKKANLNALPEVQTLNLSTLQRIEMELREANRDYATLDERRTFLEGELASLNPHDRMITDSGSSVMSPLGRLKMLETQRLQLLSQYSSTHPDVMRANREIAALRQQLGYGASSKIAAEQVVVARDALVVARKRYGDQHPEVKRLQRELEITEAAARETSPSSTSSTDNTLFEPDSPAYLQTRSSLNALELQQKALQEKKRQLLKERTDYDRRLAAAPAVEKQYRELLAEIDSSTLKFNEIKAKQAEAKLAQSLETEQKGERFTLIEPPLEPETPVSPQRLVLSVTSFLIAAALAIGVGYFLEMMDKSIRSIGVIERIVGQAPLAVIPYMHTDAESQRSQTQWFAGYAVIALVLLLLILSVHLFYKPLDVLYYVLMRKYGI